MPPLKRFRYRMSSKISVVETSKELLVLQCMYSYFMVAWLAEAEGSQNSLHHKQCNVFDSPQIIDVHKWICLILHMFWVPYLSTLNWTSRYMFEYSTLMTIYSEKLLRDSTWMFSCLIPASLSARVWSNAYTWPVSTANILQLQSDRRTSWECNKYIRLITS